MSYKILIVGAGYVGLSIGSLLAKDNQVTFFDIDKTKLDRLNNHLPSIDEKDFSDYFKSNKLDIFISNVIKEAVIDKDYIFICLPVEFNETNSSLDTSNIDAFFDEAVKYNTEATYVIKSTVPVGYSSSVKNKYDIKLIFSPEFLRERKALSDEQNPSRIIVSGDNAGKYINLISSILDNTPEVLITTYKEAEAIKLFSNTYLALRVAYFNELDNYAKQENLDISTVIKGISLDPRIGDYYNKVSTGYAGKCLPSSVKEVSKITKGILISSIDPSNEDRKKKFN